MTPAFLDSRRVPRIPGTITSKQVKDHSIKAVDLAPGVAGPQGSTGTSHAYAVHNDYQVAGNLVISGNQEVQTDNDIRVLSVDGIVRPEDITSANTINHTQIASARIGVTGRGDQSRVQKTPAGQALVEKFSPF